MTTGYGQKCPVARALAVIGEKWSLLILRDLGYWSHFPGDASMPLHTSQHFYGWGPYPNPQGYATGDAMELFVKGTFVRNNIKRDVVKSLVPPYDACACSIWDRSYKLILNSNKFVVPMYELDKKGAFKAAAPEARLGPVPRRRRS